MYIDGRPKATWNIVGLINNTQPVTINKKRNYIFEGHEGNRVFICVIKSIATREEFLIDHNFNRINTNISIMGAVCIQFYTTCKKCLLYVMIIIYYNIFLYILYAEENF